MAEKVKCKLCGFTTVRCGIGNHLKRKHPELKEYSPTYFDAVVSLGKESKEERLARQAKRKQS